MSIIIRKATVEDACNYAACHIACWRDAYIGMIPDEYLDNLPSEQERRTERFRQTLYEPNGCQYYCAELDGEMVGMLIFNKSRDEDKPDAGEIYAIYLRGKLWGKGYGREMMDFALDELNHMGHRETVVWVLEENARARRFYEKCGFHPDGVSKEIVLGSPLIEVRYVLT